MAQVKGITTSESGSTERENRRAAVEAHKASGGNTARTGANAKVSVNVQSNLERAQPGLHKNNVGGYTLVKDASARTAGEQRTYDLMQQREHEISRYNEMATYFNSGSTDYDSTSRYLQEARDFANNSKDEPRKNAWLEMANAMETQSWVDNSKRKADTQAQIDALEQQAKQTHNEMVSAATSIAMLGFDLNGEATKTHDELAKQLAGIKQQQNQLQALLDSYGPNTNAELDELQARLTKATDARATWKVYKELGAKNQHEAGYMKQQDQIRADELNAMMANPQQYYNLNDRMAGLVGSKETGLVGSALNIGAWSLEGLLHDNEQTREAQLEYDNAERAFLATGDPKYQEEMAAAEAKLAAAEQAIANGEAERNSAVTKVEQWADTFDTASQTEIQKAKEGLNKYGQFGMDMASTALDIGFDALTGAPLASMFGRVLGSSIGEARRAGATHGQQAAYGLTKASIELVTEKISDGLGVVYGKGVSTDIVEAAIEKLAKSEAGANLLRGIAGALGEGTEEVISDLLDPFTQWIINEDARNNHVYELDQSELLRDFLLGAAMGLMGQGVEAAQGGYAEKNAEIAKNDQATIEATENAEATGQQLSERDLRRLELAESRLAPKGARGIKGALDVDEKGRIIAHSGEGENRHQKATNTLYEGATQTNYGKDVDVDEAYKTSTSGAEERLPSADGAAGTEYGYDPTQDEPPPENTKGGDARADEERALKEEEIKEKTKQAYEIGKARVASVIDDIIQNSEKDNRGNILIKTMPTSRDPEFIAKNEKLESMVGNMLESGEDARAITQYTLRQMKAASKEMPIYAIKTKGKGVRKTIKYDGVTLTMITEGKDGKPKVVTIGPEDVVKQAKYLQGTTGSNAYASITPEQYYQVDVPQRGLKIVDLAEEMFEMVGAGSNEFPTAETFAQKQAEMEAAVNAKDYRIYERIGLDPPGAYEAAVASETAPEAQAEPTQQITPEETVGPVKPQGNVQEQGLQVAEQNSTINIEQSNGGVTDGYEQLARDSSVHGSRRGGIQENGSGANDGTRDGGVSRLVSRSPKFTGETAEADRTTWVKQAEEIERAGGKILSQRELSNAQRYSATVFKTLTGKPLTYYDASNMGEDAQVGMVVHNKPNAGAFVAVNHPKLRRVNGGIANGPGTASFHESLHLKWAEFGSVTRKFFVRTAVNASGITPDEFNGIMRRVIETYGFKYGAQAKILDKLGVKTNEEWKKLSVQERDNRLSSLPKETRNSLYEKLYEELANFAVVNDARFYDNPGYDKLVEAMRTTAVDAGFITQQDLDKGLRQAARADEQAITAKEAGNVPTESSLFEEPYLETADEQLNKPHTPGTARESQSTFESTQATKGERTNTEENAKGHEGTFVSRTNADRTATANSLTDTQEKRDAQTKRLLESENWTDDDVVIAQKLMFDMLKGIRDYQLHLKRKMKPEAFKVMTQQYNSLLQRHKKMLSEAGQKLQANYEFTNGEKILTRAAHTFLGFTEDGRFAGGSPNAKNARIYSAIEDASERIAKAVEAGDRQSLAKICKDISDIRNVKKMFGPLGKFASDMESRNLSRLTTSENGLQMLENLAYGNLNAMCDDVQPYKHLNAVKTIRVMNMLSNMSTIVNNVANNWVQGATGNNALAQTMTKIASKPFANLTGQEVYATAGRGKAVRQQVRNAKMEALEMATLAQMYGITYENGRLELNDRGMFNPNINMFEQTMSLYKFLIGMGVEATDQVQAAGIAKRMEAGLDREIAAGNISPQMKEQMMNEINHETSRLLYKDNNTFTNFVQTVRNFLNKIAHVGNEDIGTIGLGDITMAFAKIPANVVKTRLMMSPEGALYNVALYAKGVNKAKQMHSEVMAKNIAQDDSLSDAAKWAKARQECSGRVYKKLTQIRDNYAQGLTFEHAVERAGYMQATEMSQFEMAQLSRKIGRAATSVGMVALGSILRGLGALRDFDQEPDDELKRMYREKGYSGLMINFNAIGRKGHEWKDGDTVIGGDFLEVIAMPLAIGAAAAESAGNAEDLNVDKYFKTVFGEGLEKAFTAVGDIPGMTDALNLYDSVSNSFANNDDIGGTLGSSALLYAANTMPSLFIPNAFSQAAAGLDNTMRDIYTSDNVWEQAWNTVKNKGGVLIRQTIPASVDVWGNERTYGENRFMGMVNKSLLPGDARIFHQSKYEKEVERLVKAGYKGAIPKTSVSGSFEVSNETYKLTADEKRGFKLGRNQAQAVAFETFMDSKWYQELNDDQRMKVFQALKTSAERDARQMVLDDRQLNVEVTRDKWETELGNVNDQIQFLAAKQLAGYVWDRDEREVSDFAEMDNYLATTYDKLSDKQRELLNNSYSHLDDMNEARAKYGISSQMWQQAYDIYSDYNSDEGKARTEGGYKDWEQSEMWTKIANTTGATEKQMEFFTNNMKLYNHIAPQAEKYQTLVGSGWSRDSAHNLTKAMSDLKAINGNKTVSYKQRLTQIAKATDISEDQKWEAFFEYCPSSYTSIINKMVARRNRGVPYDKALREIGKWME